MTDQKTIEQHRAEFEAWLYLDQIEYEVDDLNKKEIEVSFSAWLAARGVKENKK